MVDGGRKDTQGEKLSTICPPKKIFENGQCQPCPALRLGSRTLPGLLLWNRESADRWPSQSDSLSVKHMRAADVDVMPAA